MEESTDSLMDSVVQFPTTGALAAAALGYRMLSSIVEDLGGVAPPSPTSSLEMEPSHIDKSEGLGLGLGLGNTNAKKANSSILSTDWFWGSRSSSSSSLKQYSSSSGFDKDSGLPLFTLQDVSLHDMHHDCWLVLYDRVYDITRFLNSHPGGDEVMLEYAGHDATLAFRGVGHSKEAEESLKPYLIGILVESERIWTRFFNMKSDVP